MATVTPNFNFPVPQSTDLVKDGATAIAALGTSIDTQFVDLKGGTTGQVLAKASNTDLDYSWVTSDDANAIQNTIVDAKGDLIAASASDVPARLAVGNNGETLVADSSTSTGLRYNPQNDLVNPIINGGFDIWQRGTSFAGVTGVVYCADRWNAFRGSSATGSTFSRQVTGDTTNLPNIQYAMRVQRDSGTTSTVDIILDSTVETANTIPYAGKTVTVSFYARKGANYSQGSSNLNIQLRTGTGTDQNDLDGFTGLVVAINEFPTLNTTWTRFAYTVALGSTVTEMATRFVMTPSGTAGAADYFDVTGVQIDYGTYTASTAPAFRRAGGTIQGELACAQRYFQKTYSQATAPATTTAIGSINGVNSGTTLIIGLGRLPVVMRTAPTITLYSSATGATGQVRSGGADVAATAADVGDGGIGYLSATGLTAGGNSTIHYAASAEL